MCKVKKFCMEKVVWKNVWQPINSNLKKNLNRAHTHQTLTPIGIKTTPLDN